jgi:hypothetical protein
VFAVALPPAELDVVHASDAALAAYGVPPRPDRERHADVYAKWKRAMTAHFTRQEGPLRIGRVHGNTALLRAKSAAGTKQNTTLYSGNWSGFIDLTSTTAYNQHTSLQSITADLYVPVVAAANCNSLEDSSAWAGIDGVTNSDVLQAGAEADVACGTPQTSDLWFEWAPYAENITPLAAQAGDEIYVQVWNTSATTGYAFIGNYRTGKAVEYVFGPPPGYSLVGNSAEWILEAATVNGSISTLPVYAPEQFTAASATSFAGTAYYPGSAGNDPADMVQNNTIVSVPVPTGKTSFVTIYQ